MGKLKVLSLFSGIGSPEKALTNLKIDHEIVGFSEIDEAAIKAYCAIHNVDENLNIGDITKIYFDNLPENIDLITHGSPCQSYSKAGKGEGGDKDSGTRSSLMWNTVEIVGVRKPKYVIWENVPNVLSKRHRHNFNQYLNDMSELGYENYYKIINARHHGIPQNRERVFVVSVSKDLNQEFSFPGEEELTVSLLDLLDSVADEKYYLCNEKQNELINHIEGNQIFIKNATKLGYLPAYHGDGVDFNYPKSETRRGRVQPQRSHTLTRGSNVGVLYNGRLRKYTPLETYKLMGFDEEDYIKAVESGSSDKEIYSQAGNSIVVNVMEAIFKELFKIN